MSTKENPGPYDCYANAAPDEPMFVLLAREKHAPALVWLWATMRVIHGETPEKIAEARECADAMIQWQLAHDRRGVGLAEPLLAAAFELIRVANFRADEMAQNSQTTVDLMRAYLSHTKFADEAPAEKVAP